MFLWISILLLAAAEPATHRTPRDAADRDYWIRNMARHGFSVSEMNVATGLSTAELEKSLHLATNASWPTPGTHLLVLPYPGGRHPRIGFLDGAVRPQRETKVSVFLPWPEAGYVVVDVPEALWSNLGLTYLAHTHIPTVFDKQGITLEPLEWDRSARDGSLRMARRLPNGISYGALVQPGKDAVRMELALTNGTGEALRDLRVQNCVMLKRARGFSALTNANKVFQKPYVACRSDAGDRWIITAWDPCDRVWGNAPVPCLHSDPKFPDCPPGEHRRLRGWLSFYAGTNVLEEISRIEKIRWRTAP